MKTRQGRNRRRKSRSPRDLQRQNLPDANPFTVHGNRLREVSEEKKGQDSFFGLPRGRVFHPIVPYDEFFTYRRASPQPTIPFQSHFSDTHELQESPLWTELQELGPSPFHTPVLATMR